MPYVDGFLIAVPKKNLRAYEKMARGGAKAWKKHGALEYRECVADDLDTEMGTSFKKLLKLKPTETAIFAYIAYRSRADRDRVNKKVMAELGDAPEKMPFEMRRMSYGGFSVLVDA